MTSSTKWIVCFVSVAVLAAAVFIVIQFYDTFRSGFQACSSITNVSSKRGGEELSVLFGAGDKDGVVVKYYWIDYDGNWRLREQFDTDGSFIAQTNVGHLWVVQLGESCLLMEMFEGTGGELLMLSSVMAARIDGDLLFWTRIHSETL